MSPSSPAPSHRPPPTAARPPAAAPHAASSSGVGVVDVWSARVDHATDPAADLATLDERERERAARFRFDRDRDRYVARHAFYRRVLADYVGVAPAAVRIRTSSEGRPELVWPDAPDFNPSHADGLAVIAVSHGGRVGVDIERDRDIEDALDLAEAHATGRERAFLRAAPQAARSRAFLALWTRKEAVVKAAGGGLSIPLDGFDTGLTAALGPCRVDGLPDGRSFVVTSLDGLAGHIGSVALEAGRVVVRHMRPGMAA